MSRSKFLLLALTALFVVPLYAAVTTVTYGVGACGLTGLNASYPTISAALAATPSPSLVRVCPGTYREQVVITFPVTLQGAVTNDEGQAFIAVPSGGLVANATNAAGTPVAAGVFVDNVTGPVDISNIGVDGDGNGIPSTSDTYVAGIFYKNSSGTVNQVETRYQEADGFGVGIWAEAGSAKPAVIVENSNAHDFDFNGIRIEGASSSMTATVEGNTVVLPNNISNTIFGIYLDESVSVTVSGNFINGQGYAGADGIATYMDTGTSAPTGSISNNTITSTNIGMLIVFGNPSVTSNKIYDTIAIAIDAFAPAVVKGNTITQAQWGISFECVVNNNVSSNTITAIHTYGIFNVPTSVTSTNTYYNVSTIRSGGC
jgi:nitrous oxidase accessory protein NosD